MADSIVTAKKQKTPKGGWPEEVRVETGGNSGVRTGDTASGNGNDDAPEVYTSNLLELIFERGNMISAYDRVVGNKGSHGIDNMTVDQLKPYIKENWEEIKSQLLAGTYKPKAVRRVEIPKPDGGIRLLGVPTVLDRMIQQAIAQVLNGIFDPEFSESSFGFRQGRSAHDAIKKAQEYISEGYKWVVDIHQITTERQRLRFCPAVRARNKPVN